MTQSTDRRHEVTDRLTSRAAGDPAFRRLLVDDPHAAVQDELGVTLPADVTMTVLEESADHLYLVLPATSSSDSSHSSGELSDAQLSGVAGGSFEDWWNGLHWPSASPC